MADTDETPQDLGTVATTPRGFEFVTFFDHNERECSLQQSSAAICMEPGTGALWLGLDHPAPEDGRMHLHYKQAESLRDMLTRWLDTGHLKP